MAGLINAAAVEKPEDYRNIFVYLENRNGELQRPALEMIGVGKRLAEKVHEKLYCVLIGSKVSEMADEAASYGCDVILGAESPDLAEFRTMPYARLVEDFVKREKPNIFLIPATRNGRDLASRIAVSCQAGVTADCTEIDIEEDTRILSANRPTYGESMLAEILCKKHRPQMATARAGIFPVPEKVDGSKCERRIEKVKVDKALLKKEILEFRKKEAIDLTAAKVVVSGGLGLGAPAAFKLVEKLANEMNGVVGASRPTADLGWISRDHQVGQTGQTVRPRLYVACGISGKIQHIMGMKNSENVLSINIDQNAEIFKYSDYVIVDDVNKVLPALTEEIKKYKKAHVKKTVKSSS
ncbi:MAG: electron transfer flavoprotein subunit alpha/FixB family protein [Candidatus Thermoplasmatota archaeon]|jgi:electron transfer flavoprotein alpha subunit|nr:electron transfer flavoprotein subunit alpha/FixB family protein [Candidatus Thermoplasmatota archaeon]MCL5794133.1 electron transfer flavoprotein subunit alpha/FixB family protein [Candidatus Thermoplasmatota archaeon]